MRNPTLSSAAEARRTEKECPVPVGNAKGVFPGRVRQLTIAVLGGILCVACSSVNETVWSRGAYVAEGLPVGSVIVADYAGKYKQDQRLPSALAALSRAAGAAQHRIEERLSRTDLALPPVSVCMVDSEAMTFDGFAGSRLLRTRRGGPVGVILCASEAVITDVVDLEAVVAHEVVHVLQASWSGDTELPTWLCEGMAHWVGFAEDAAAEEYVLSYGLRNEPDASYVPLSQLLESDSRLLGADFRAQDAAGTAIFLMLTRTRGAEFVERLVTRLLAARDWRTVLEAECGAPCSQVLREVRDEFDLWGRSIRAVTDVIKEAGRRSVEGDHSAALRSLSALLSGDVPAGMRGWVERAHWGIQLHSGDPAAARASIHAFRLRHPHHPLVVTSWIDELHVLVALEQWSEVRTIGAMVMSDLLWLERWADQRDWVRSLILNAQGKRDRDRFSPGSAGSGVR